MMMMMGWVELYSIFEWIIDEKNERAYIAPDDTIFVKGSSEAL